MRIKPRPGRAIHIAGCAVPDVQGRVHTRRGRPARFTKPLGSRRATMGSDHG